MKRLVVSATAATLLFAASSASAITREEALVKARSYALHKWRATQANTVATCHANYQSGFQAGDYVGVSYDWGGYKTLGQFDQEIAAGQGAGSPAQGPISDCTTGVDCSGFVSQVWGVGHNTTSSFPDITDVIAQNALTTGDVFNKAGYHVAMFTHMMASGEPANIEAYGYNVNINLSGGWSHVSGYTPRRLPSITGTQTTANPLGTTTNPIPITAFPFNDARNTAASPSRVLDTCNIAPGTPQKGPEYVYVANITQPGMLTVSVTDDAAADIDVQIHAGMPAPHACKARNDATTQLQVGCGNYYVVADTYGSDASKAGNYDLTVTFAPSGQACSAVPGPAPFNPKGEVGDACAYPGHEDLPFCNPNLGGEICIYSAASSFCSVACASNDDCSVLPGGGCCEELSAGEKYCVTQNLCGQGGTVGTTPTPGGTTTEPSDTGEEPGTTGEPGVDEDGDGVVDGVNPTKKKVTTSSCAASPGGSAGWELLAFAALGLVAVRRRR